MKVTGIIAEYNPFHQGHAYHLSRARELTGADRILVVMGGNFMQRGEPAIIDKYTRTEMALRNGADLVLELPAASATGSAEYFAEGAVELLDASGVVNELCFGSELGELEPLEKAAELLLEEPEDYQELLRAELKKGKTFPEARETALSAFLPEQSLLASPNNILAIEYIKALKRRKSSIRPLTIQRLGSYHGEDGQPAGAPHTVSGNLPESFASASTIRCQLHTLEKQIVTSCEQPAFGSLMTALAKELPPSSFGLLKDVLLADRLVQAEDFSLPLHYRLMQAKEPLEFSVYLDVSEELSRRIYSLRQEFTGLNAFLDLVRTRQYTRSRVSRALLHILLDIRQEEVLPPTHLRVLGFRREASDLLSEIKKKSRLPLITKAAGHPELSEEIRISSLYHLGNSYNELSRPLVIL
ncbi:nucleotidyltransferase [Blautia sp. OF03-15BH]|uniref:nucleotidyltransferase n=1 Tax=Blautia sp. OF03-15BH TaxID=2292287 RepID=UPI000E50DC80|nr:nucleotidyltransferase [Blautia sp. OF03-15BH]RGY02274.1 nucleotidyltransferase [Blautia sp. OF03-15BH]